MNVGIGTLTAQFLFWEYLFQTFDIGFLQGESLTPAPLAVVRVNNGREVAAAVTPVTAMTTGDAKL